VRASVAWRPWRRAGIGESYRATLAAIWLPALIVVVGLIAIYVLTRPPGQRQVSASVLPVASGAQVKRTFTDCSKVNSLTYDPEQPCQAFVLVKSIRFASLSALIAGERARLLASDWRRSALPLLMDNDSGLTYAPRAVSWAAPNHQACAVVVTDAVGVRAEGKVLFPYDAFDMPSGLYRFYRNAKASDQSQTLWVQLIPGSDKNGHPAC
jgi:hypothetical protein